MGFSDDLRKLADPVWRRSLSHPFVSGIGDGSLPVEKFKFYVRQDYVFLVEYSRVLALAVAKGEASRSDKGRMTERFLLSSRFEHAFWQTAWTMESA